MHDQQPLFELRFNQTEADILTFHDFHYSNSPTVRRSLLTGKVILGCIFGLLAIRVTLSWDEQHRVTAYLALAGIALLAFLVYGPIYHRRYLRAARRMLAEGRNRDMLGDMTLRFWPDRFVATSPLSTTEFLYSAVERVAETESCFYLYLNAFNAIVVKKSLLPQAEQLARFKQLFALP